MDREELHSLLLQDLNERKEWEAKQVLWYDMRHEGVRRAKKPWNNASDLHYALCDIKITELKPGFYQQIFSSEHVAKFIADRQENVELAGVAEKWFDWKIKSSNFPDQAVLTIDSFLMRGGSFLKIRWYRGAIRFDVVDMMETIFPSYTNCIKETDRFVHVIEMPIYEYKRNKNFNQNPEFVKSITGRVDTAKLNDTVRLDQAKRQREGLTQTQKDQIIVIWEAYTRDEEGKVYVERYSPLNTEEDITPRMGLPYDHGQIPFVFFRNELKERDFYSSRGVCELLAMYESYANKLLNEQSDRITLSGRPVYRTDRPIPNMNNFRLTPGMVVAGKLEVVDLPASPVDYNSELVKFTQLANQRAGSPFSGITDSPQPMQNPKTKFEIQTLQQLNTANMDLRARLFRESCTEVYEQAWLLLIQFEEPKKELSFYYRDQIQHGSPDILKNVYRIIPSGNADGQTKEMQIGQAMQMMQMFNNDPFINQPQLRKMLLEVKDPSLIDKLFIDPGIQQVGQMEQQELEILLLDQQMPVQVKPDDKDEVHIDVLMGRVMSMIQKGMPPQAALQVYWQHAMDHMAALEHKNKGAFKMYKQKIDQLMAQLKQMMAQQAQQMQLQGGQPGLPQQPQTMGGQNAQMAPAMVG